MTTTATPETTTESRLLHRLGDAGTRIGPVERQAADRAYTLYRARLTGTTR
jgi:hypothetical protein